MTDRELLLQMWDETRDANTWWPAMSAAFAGLTAEQARWKPASGRHSIWQILNHINFWREVVLRRIAGEKVPADELDQRNFEEPADASEKAWRAAGEHFAALHAKVRVAMTDPKAPIDRLKFILPHDVYHIGQVMYLRAMLGLEAVKYE